MRPEEYDSEHQQRFFLALALCMALALGATYLMPTPDTGNTQGEESTEQVARDGNEDSGENEAEEVPENSDDSGEDATEQQEDTGTDPDTDGSGSTDRESPEDPASTEDDDSSGEDARQEEEESTEMGNESTADREEEIVTLENEDFRAFFSNEGARLTKLVAKEYYRTADEEDEVVLLDGRFNNPPDFDINPHEEGDLQVDDHVWEIVRTNEEGDRTTGVTFRTETEQGLILRKSFSLDTPQEQFIKYEVSFGTDNESVELPPLRLNGPAGIVMQNRYDPRYHDGVLGLPEDLEGNWSVTNGFNYDHISENGMEPRDLVDDRGWAGTVNKYFANIFIPSNPPEELVGVGLDTVSVSEDDEPGFLTSGPDETNSIEDIEQEARFESNSVIPYFLTSSLEIGPDEEKTFTFGVYSGPKDEAILNEYSDLGLSALVSYGIFPIDPIARFFLWILGTLNGIMGNYGFAILFLTIILQICLHPLTRKAQVSMHKMKDLQPKIEELREKYEDDRQKMGEKQMELFREHGVNPLGGCLPMLLQMPILIGLYYGIFYSFNLRQQDFILWINDLSQPDNFAYIGAGEVFGLDFNYLNLLVVLMIITWMIQAFTRPTPSGGGSGPDMGKIMKFMPVVVGIIFYNFPAGLVLYWMTRTGFSALEQYWIKNYVLPEAE